MSTFLKACLLFVLLFFPASITQSSPVNIQHLAIIDNYLIANSSVFVNNTEFLLWEKANKYGLNFQLFTDIIYCECSKPNHEQCIGDGGLAFGRAQFHLTTFKHFCEGDYYSESDQLECAAKMISEGNGYHWTCYRKLNKK